MTAMVKRWYRSRRFQIIIFIVITICLIYYISLNGDLHREADLDLTRRDDLHEYVEKKLEEALKLDHGTGCEIPYSDPFSPEIMKFDKKMPKIECEGTDWVKCYLSECKVVKKILSTTHDITCTYYDILYYNDHKYKLGPGTDVKGTGVYTLTKSDHVKIKCTGTHEHSVMRSKWIGYSLGFRTTVERLPPPPTRENTLNVLIFVFDSTSRNGFIRKMPKSYKYLTEEIKGTILEGYNIVGDGTPAAIFPILTGKTELELPDVRKATKNSGTLDDMPFIFYKLKKDGYRTAYFEDMPWIGTFQYRFKGFLKQPADHYLRAFYLDEAATSNRLTRKPHLKYYYCVGDTPQYELMMNITEQFFKLDGKKFGFTFIADITHDDFNMISTADDATVKFMSALKNGGHLENTLLFVMGDHGARYANLRSTLQGKLEERLPLMFIRLPEKLIKDRPSALEALKTNARLLSTPHDIHATVLDALGMTEYRNMYKVRGASVPRAMSLLGPIPKNRSCSEAGIEPHWCVCVSWSNVSREDKFYEKAAQSLLNFINQLTEPKRQECEPRYLNSIAWVMKNKPNSNMLSFIGAKDADGYVGKFGPQIKIKQENYQVKINVGPGSGEYEASMLYMVDEDKFVIDARDISRTNAYGEEPSCISATDPHLNMYCYCKKYLKLQS